MHIMYYVRRYPLGAFLDVSPPIDTSRNSSRNLLQQKASLHPILCHLTSLFRPMFFVLFFLPQAPATTDIPTPHQSHLKGGRFHHHRSLR
jgi:hypothetical protein